VKYNLDPDLLKMYRKKAGFENNTELAKKVGIHLQTLGYRLRNGFEIMDAAKLAEILNVRIDQLERHD